MSLTGILLIVLAAVLSAFLAYLVWVLEGLRRTLRSVDALAKHLDEQIVPLALKASHTLDDINDELEHVDGIVRAVEDVTHRVSATAEMARHALSSPLVKLAGWSAGLKRAASTLTEGSETAPGKEE